MKIIALILLFFGFTSSRKVYLNEFSVKIPENWDATEIAQKYGFINLGKAG